MGFYLPHTIVEDLKRHRVEVRSPDVLHSDWDSTLEGPTVRLGLRLIHGLGEKSAKSITFERSIKPFNTIDDLQSRCDLTSGGLFRLAAADAFRSFGIPRREALWKVEALSLQNIGLLSGHPLPEPAISFPPLKAAEQIANDYGRMGLSTLAHPVSLLREEVSQRGGIAADRLTNEKNGSRVRSGGMVIVRQRPPTAKGMLFLTLEDETGFINVAIPPNRYEGLATTISESPFLLIEGRLQRDGEAVSILASKAWPLSFCLTPFPAVDRSFFDGKSESGRVLRQMQGETADHQRGEGRDEERPSRP
jgi:error-prone DNA polymerase